MSDLPPAATHAVRAALPCPQGLVEQYQQQYLEQAWAPLVTLLQSDLRQPAPSAAQLERGGRQAVKDKWAAANKILEAVLAQQVRGGGEGQRFVVVVGGVGGVRCGHAGGIWVCLSCFWSVCAQV